MCAIQVRYLPATTHKGSRMKAFEKYGNSVTLPYDHAFGDTANAREAADSLIEKMNLDAVISGSGILPNGDYVFTLCASPEKKDD